MKVYAVTVDDSIFWVGEDDYPYINEQFGDVQKVVQYDLINELDVTADISGLFD